MDVVSALLNIALVFILVFLNGFFVAAEFAMVKVRSTQIEPLAKGGSKRATIAQQVVTHLDTYLSACQLGITMTSLALGWIGEPFVARQLEPAFLWLGITQPAIIHTISFGFGFALITYLHIAFGELAPKSMAIQRPQAMILAIASPLHMFYVVFRPFISFLNKSANSILRLSGNQQVSEAEISHSQEELRLILSKGKTFSSTGKKILLNAMELQNRSVREVMVPRTSVVFLSTEKTLEENMTIVLDNQFTRYPLCERNLDNVLGMIHLKDLIKVKGERGSGAKLLDIKREMIFVPETTSLERILNTFLAKRVLMAIAVDEYGGTAGLVTLENVLEELVGDIRDEFDVEPLMVQRISDSEFLVDGTMPLHDFARMFDIVPDTRDVVTVSGYAIQLLGRVPERGAALRIGPWAGSVEATEKRKVKTLRIKKVQTEAQESG